MFRKAKVFLYLNLALLLMLLLRGLFIYQGLDNRTSVLAGHYNKKIKFKAYVCQEREVSYKQQRLVLCLADEKILVTRPLYPEYDYGDYLEVYGKLKQPEIFSDFNYPRYLASQDIYATMYYPSIKVLEADLSFKQETFLGVLKLKKKLKTTLNYNLPEPEASLANALILGYKKSLYSEDKDSFRKAGLSHLMVISGTHISILAGLFFSALIFIGLNRKQALRFLFLFFIFYPLLIGFSAAALRASIMGALVFLAYYFGRLSNSKTALVLAANIILFYKPLLAYTDIGFQLSFAALLGIIYIYPLTLAIRGKIERRALVQSKILVYFFEAFSLTLACQIAIFPITSYHFKSFASLSFLSNPLIAWLVPLLIASLSLALLVSLIFPSLGLIFFSPAYLLLKLFNTFAKYLASFESFFIALPSFGASQLTYYYLILFSSLYLLKKRRNKKLKKGKKGGLKEGKRRAC